MKPNDTPVTANTQVVEPGESVSVTVSAAAQPGAPKPAKKGRKKKIGIGILILLVLLITGAVLGYFLWYQNPDKTVHDAISRVIAAESVRYKSTLNITSDDGTFRVTSDSTMNNVDGSVNVSAFIAIPDSDTELEVSGSVVFKSDAVYLKVDALEEILELVGSNDYFSALSEGSDEDAGVSADVLTDIVARFDGRWVKLAPSDYDEQAEEVSDMVACFAKIGERVQNDRSYSDELVRTYRDNQFVVVDNDLGIKDIDGVRSVGYEVRVDKDITEQFTRAVADTKIGRELRDCDDTYDYGEIADEIAGTSDWNDSDTDLKTELWVNRYTHEITQLSVVAKDDTTELSYVLTPVFNEEVNVEVPADAISISELFEELYEVFFEQMMQDMLLDEEFSEEELDAMLQMLEA